jgi:hypothetical protein
MTKSCLSRVTVSVLLASLWTGAVLAGGASVTDLLVGKGPGGAVVLDWSACHPGPSVTTYGVYAGVLGDFTSHAAVTCDAGEYTRSQFVPPMGNAYFLVVQASGGLEGSYGSTSFGERPNAVAPCVAQSIGSCVTEDLGRCFYQTSPPVGWRIVASPGTGAIYMDTDPGNGDGQIDNCACSPL